MAPAAVLVAAACHSGAPPAGPTPAAADRLDRAARVCAMIASCAHPHDPPREREPAACVEAWLARAPAEAEPLETCLAAAVGCAQVDACARGRRDALATAYCRAHAGARTACEGARLVTCSEDDPGESTSTDCAAFGALCGDSKQSGGLLARACLSPALCPQGAPEVRCDGPANAVVSCHEGAVERTACPAPARCEEHRAADGAVSAVCEPPGHRHCEAVGKRWCEQGKLAACEPHGPFGEAVVTDCAALGLVCDERPPSEAAACVAPGAHACDKTPPRCEGDALAFCAAGRRFRMTCRDLGFSACDPDAHGVEAACAAGPATDSAHLAAPQHLP
jgi:hypothetical protein